MLHQTALHATHEALGATLVDFGGWDMPLWYPTGAVKEHLAVIQHAVFDEPGCAGTDSHFGEPQIRGDVSKRGAAITQRLDNCQIGFVELGFHDIPMGRGLAKAGIHSQNQYAFCKNFSFKKG